MQWNSDQTIMLYLLDKKKKKKKNTIKLTLQVRNDVVACNKPRSNASRLYFRNVSVRRRNAQEKKKSSRVMEGLSLPASIRHRLLGVYHVWLHLCDRCNLPPSPPLPHSYLNDILQKCKEKSKQWNVASILIFSDL